MTQTLRPYQMDLVGRVRLTRGQGHRIIVAQAATGSGKTSWACYVISLAVGMGKKVLAIVHRRRLVKQFSDKLGEFGIDHGIIMNSERPNGSALVQVASRDTLMSRAVNNEWIGLPTADLVIVDEGHHAAMPDSDYRKILARYPNATIILLTATPVGPDGRGMGGFATAIECAAPISELIRDGYLVPVKCFAPESKMRGKKRTRGIAGDLVESWNEFACDMPTVLFCSRVQHSQDAVAEFIKAGIPAAHVDASTPDDIRDSIFEELARGELKVVSNVGIIKEGVDVPCLGCCQIYMEMGGRVSFLQAVGRIMRPSPGKEFGVLIDHAGCVFKHGFPDEDTEWTLGNNTDEDFKKKHDAGETKTARYCKHCELVYHSALACPQCGRMPVKPPKSIFAPEPQDRSSEILVEADREAKPDVAWEQEKATWFACLHVAIKRDGNFLMASTIFKNKYGRWPSDKMPLLPPWDDRRKKIRDVYPNFGRKKESA